VAALLGDGGWDVLSWIALGAPIGVVARFIVRADRRGGPGPRRR
jgi:hypothetical protein